MKKIILIILFLFITSNCFGATQLLKTVEEDGNGDYTSLEACMNANEQNLVTADKYFDVQICGTDLGGGGWDNADTTAVTIHNYTTDATRYINIYTTASARHNGTSQANSGGKNYRLSGMTNVGITSNCSYTTIDGIEILNVTGLYSTSAGITFGATYQTAKNNIIHDIGLTSDRGLAGIANSNQSNNYIFNNIIYRVRNIGIRINAYASNVNTYNNTVYDYNRGNGGSIGLSYEGSNTGNCKNNLVIAGATGGTCYQYNGATAATNGGSDTSGEIDNLTAANLFEDITVGSEDLHLKAGAEAIDVGTDLGSPYDYDIDGDFRDTYTPWDIGADEFVSAAPSALPLVIINNL